MFYPGEIDISFVSHEAYRQTIQLDLSELESAVSMESPKTIMVLSGCITEALLLSSLDRLGHKPKKSLDDLTLGELIQEADGQGLLSKESSKMSDLVKDFRNLIHPGRQKRIGTSIDMETAQVSLTLLRLIHRDILVKLKESLGWTAEQLFNKAVSDRNFFSIANHLLDELSESELLRLVKDVIPCNILRNDPPLPSEFEAADLTGFNELNFTCKRLFHASFNRLPDEEKKTYLHEFSELIKKESQEILEKYEEWLFDCSMLKDADPLDKGIILEHVLENAKSTTSVTVMQNCSQMILHLDKDNVKRYYDIFFRKYLGTKDVRLRRAIKLIVDEFWELSNAGSEIEAAIIERTDEWQENLTGDDERGKLFDELAISLAF